MLLAVDIGNTNVVLGVVEATECRHFWRLASDARRPADEYAALLFRLFEMDGVDARAFEGAVVGSVVPALSGVFDTALRRVTGVAPFHVTHESRLPVRNGYRNPAEVGIDRLANAAAAIQRLGAPVLIVDLGTAVTVDVVSRRREYLGGAILPGIEMSAEALARRTARLPVTSPDDAGPMIGRTTADSIRSGILHGLVGAVDHIIEGVWKELGYATAAVATGGLADYLTARSRHVHRAERDLTLAGLAEIWHLNRGGRRRGRETGR
jgi:type III pantothenate kinase